MQPMMNNDDDIPKLEKRTFDQLINDAFLDYLFGIGVNAVLFENGGAFHPTDTPNRNPKQVPEGTWRRLITIHLNKHLYN